MTACAKKAWMAAVALSLGGSLAASAGAGASALPSAAHTGVPRSGGASSAASVSATWVVDRLPPGVTGMGQAACSSPDDCDALAEGPSGVVGILTTNDGGFNWSLQSAPHASSLDGIACVSAGVCWAVGSIGSWAGAVILEYTTCADGYQAWCQQTVPPGVGALESISCPTASECVAVGATYSPNSLEGGDAVVTTNGGYTWEAYPTQPGLDNGLFEVSCPTALDCTATGAGPGTPFAGYIVGSTDGGQTWTQEFEVNHLGAYTGVSCPTTSDCYVVGQHENPVTGQGTGAVIEVTTDGGATWSDEMPPPGAAEGLDGVSCPSASTCWTSSGFLGVGGNYLFETTDGGVSWQFSGPLGGQDTIASPTCPDASTCIAGGTTGGRSPVAVVAMTHNAGAFGCDGTLPAGAAVGMAPDPSESGYWLASAGGGVVACGTSAFYGSLVSEHRVPSGPIVGIAPSLHGPGYFLLSRNGTVYGFGPGAFVSGSGPASAAPYLGIASPGGGGYYLVTADGGVFAFGAPYAGSLPGVGVHVHDIVAIASVAGGGYYLVGADGGVFGFGAPYLGSLPGIGVRVDDIVAVEAGGEAGLNDRGTDGYYLVGADGGVFTFSPRQRPIDPPGLPFCGSASGRTSAPVVSAALYPDSGLFDSISGYWLVGRDGGLYSFNAADDGSAWTRDGLHTVC